MWELQHAQDAQIHFRSGSLQGRFGEKKLTLNLLYIQTLIIIHRLNCFVMRLELYVRVVFLFLLLLLLLLFLVQLWVAFRKIAK